MTTLKKICHFVDGEFDKSQQLAIGLYDNTHNRHGSVSSKMTKAIK